MIYELENDKIKITASTHGGELHSITEKKDRTEYLWDGNPKGWKYHAPVLFPIVGKVNNGKYRVEGKEYELPQHGLARISEFNLIDKGENYIAFELKYSQDTLKVYPFKFALQCRYVLEDSSVRVEYKVKNLDNKKIYFSIGAHPAFISQRYNEDIEDYYFEFSDKETATVKVLNTNGYLKREEKAYLENNKIINLKKDTFDNDALIFNNLRSNKVSIKSRKNSKVLTVDFNEFPFLGLWAPTNGAKFLCIEPWYGHADYEDFKGDFKEKEDIQRLDINAEFNCSYTISIG